jgi:outer membrane receptor protein involved in Fe transport
MTRFSSTFLLVLCGVCAGAPALAQQALPTIEIGAGARRHAARAHGHSPEPRVAAAKPAPTPVLAPPPAPGEAEIARQDRLLPKVGVGAYRFDRAAIEALPRGDAATLDEILLQAPGVTRDSAAAGALHVRNEHANLQYRVNGVVLPEGVGAFAQLMETGFIGQATLLTGALPAQYGLRTAGVVDIVTRPPPARPGGAIDLYGGSNRLGQSAFTFGAARDHWEMFAAGRFTTTGLGFENPTPSHEAAHDRGRQGKFFASLAYEIDGETKLQFLTANALAHRQIPNNPGQAPQFTAFGVADFDSTRLNENQSERNFYNVLALTKSTPHYDAQLSYFSSVSNLRFTPDPVGDIVFNGVASSVWRQSFLQGLQGDVAWRTGVGHVLRAGFVASTERSNVVNGAVALPLDANGDPVDAPYPIVDPGSQFGHVESVYAQDEWKFSDQLSFNAGLRFDHMRQFVEASQLSPRASLTFTPDPETNFHLAYARYFTPPPQIMTTPLHLSLYENSTIAAAVTQSDPARPERAHYIDVGVTRKLTPELEAGVDFYYKRARNLLDDGQFGQAYTLTAYNYDRAYNSGVEVKAVLRQDDFSAYANFAFARQRATQVTSNQYLFDPDELNYIARNYVYTDHAQRITVSAGASYVIFGARASTSVIYGSGLRAGFANTDHVSPYAQVNLGLSRDFAGVFSKPLTLRLDVVNLLDHRYTIRDGSGIGVSAPQFGPRRGVYVGLRQAF